MAQLDLLGSGFSQKPLFYNVFERFFGNTCRNSVPSAPLPHITRRDPKIRRGNLRFPLFSQCFSTCAFAEDWDPRSALGVPLGPIGFARERIFSEHTTFTTFLNGFWGTLAGGRPLPRGAFTTFCGVCLFLQGFLAFRQDAPRRFPLTRHLLGNACKSLACVM